MNTSPRIPVQGEAKFQSLLEAAPDAMVGVDASGMIRFVNRQTELLFGYERSDLVGRPIETLVPQEFRDVHPTRRDGYFADPRTRAMGAGLKLSGRRQDGTEFPVDISLSSIETEDGLLVTAAVRDITERKKIEAKFESVLEGAPDALVGVDRTGTIRFVNRRTESLFGYDRDDLVGQPIETLVPEAFREARPNHPTDGSANPRVWTIEAGKDLSGRRRDGTTFSADINLSSVETSDGLLVTAAVRDITARKKVDAKFESLLDAAPDAMVGLDQAGTIRLANRQIEVLFGYDREELVGHPMQMLVPEIFRDVATTRRDDELADVGTRGTAAGLNLTGRRRDGTEFPVDVRLSSLGSEDGLLVTAVVRDTTDRRRVEEDLQRMASIIEFSDDAVIGKSLDGVIRSWNPAAERLYGYSEAEAVGRSASMLIPPGHEDDVAAILGRVTRGERVEHYETARVSRDGRVIDVSVSASPIRDLNGVLIGASTIARDITDRTRAEATIRELNVDLESRVAARTSELAEAVEQLEGFSYSVSHDLRAPLRAIDGFSRILQEEYSETLDAEGHRLLNIIRGATSEMSTLIDDLLSFSRVGRREIDRRFIDMGEVTASVIKDLAPTFANRDLRLVVGALPPTQGDRPLIRQVLVNLLSNAIKFTATREHAHIEVGGTVEPGRNVFWVKDNGVGFDKAYEEKMFQVFQRLHAAEFEGTGVGLAIVQRIVRRHGGQVWADGSVGAGATIYVALPNKNGVTP